MVPVLNKNNYFDISKVVETSTLAPEEEVSMILGMVDDITTKTVTIIGDDDTTLDVSGTTFYKPQYVWEYFDALPAVKNFKVSSQFDVLAPDSHSLRCNIINHSQNHRYFFLWCKCRSFNHLRNIKVVVFI